MTDTRRIETPTTLREMFLLAGFLYENRVAVRSAVAHRTYRQLLDRGTRLANGLAGMGLVPGDRVVSIMEDRVETLELHVAVALAGFTLVPVNHRFKSEELGYVVADSGARAIVCGVEVSPVVTMVGAGDDMITVVVGDATYAAPGSCSFESVIASGSDRLPDVCPAPDDLAMLGYTSGTTGFPKGAMVTHRAGQAAVRASLLGFRHPLYGQCAYSGSLAFVALVWAFVYTHLHLGGTIRLLGPSLDHEHWFDVMEQDRSTFTYLPTPLTSGFIAEVRRRPQVLDHLESVCHSASPLSRSLRVELADAIRGRYVETWGMTETIASVTATTRADYASGSDADDIFSTVGRPVTPARVSLVDATGNELPPGSAGEFEILIDSPTVFAGYWNQPEKTAEVLDDGRFRTGDIGRIDSAGYLYLLSRTSDVIITGGINVYPAEIERVFDEHPAIAESAVVGVADDTWGESVAVAVVLTSGQHLTADEVVAYAQSCLAGYKKPRYVRFVDALPRNTNLKVQKKVIRSWFEPTHG